MCWKLGTFVLFQVKSKVDKVEMGSKTWNSYLFSPEIPQMRLKPLYVNITRNNESVYSTQDQYLAARVAFIKWLVTFFLEKKYTATSQNTKNGGEMLPKIIQVWFFKNWVCFQSYSIPMFYTIASWTLFVLHPLSNNWFHTCPMKTHVKWLRILTIPNPLIYSYFFSVEALAFTFVKSESSGLWCTHLNR